MPLKPAGTFGQRPPEPPPDVIAEQMVIRPSREERLQAMWTYTTIIVAVLILGVGAALRYTIFAAHFEPKHSTAPITVSDDFSVPGELTTSPSPPVTTLETASPSPVVSPTPDSLPVVAATPAPVGQTSDGEPVSPSLSETQGRMVPPK